ncbi:MAG: M48 family metallopeptidase [Alphaproteobacteria bacterium]
MHKNYHPTTFHGGHNVTKKHPLKTASKLFVYLLAILGVIYIGLGFAIDSVVTTISAEQEQWLWDKIRPNYGITEDPSPYLLERQKQVQEIFDMIPLSALEHRYPFKVLIQETPVVNAYAAPGGFIIVTSGLLDKLKTENALVFVLGHELGHFQNRDHLKSIGRELVLAKIIRAILGKDISGLFAQLTMAFENEYSRRQEYAADDWGLKLLHATFGHVGGATEFFEMIEDLGSQSSLEAFFSTHPAAKDRAKRLIKKINLQQLEMQKTVELISIKS